MRLHQLIAFIIIAIFLMITLIMLLNSSEEAAKTYLAKGGFILDLKADQSEVEKLKRHFKVLGFNFFRYFPLWRLRSLRASDVWFLKSSVDGKRESGAIHLKNFQTDLNHAEDVVVDISYHVSWEEKSGLSVIGINFETGEQVTELLNSITEPSIYCRKLVFLGPVEEVSIEAYAMDKTAFVVIDKLKVAVGTDIYDHEEEFVCS